MLNLLKKLMQFNFLKREQLNYLFVCIPILVIVLNHTLMNLLSREWKLSLSQQNHFLKIWKKQKFNSKVMQLSNAKLFQSKKLILRQMEKQEIFRTISWGYFLWWMIMEIGKKEEKPHRIFPLWLIKEGKYHTVIQLMIF